MRRLVHTSVGVFCSVMLILAAQDACAQDEKKPISIKVSGSAELLVTASEVVLTLGVETFDLDLAIAKDANDERVSAVLKVIASMGVDEEDVQTGYLNVSPQYKNRHDHGNFLRYLVRKNVVITLRDVSKFESLLSAALEAGVDYVHGIDFRATDLPEHRKRARALAIASAKSKAEELASELGMKIGGVRGIQEQGYGRMSSYGRWGQTRNNNRASDVNLSVDTAKGTMEGPTKPGRISITERVSVSFELIE